MRRTETIKRFFKDKHGKWAVVQWPNILLSGWILLMIAGFVFRDPHLHNGITALRGAVLFAWAYLELVDGSSYFRRSLGGTVLAAVIVGFFK